MPPAAKSRRTRSGSVRVDDLKTVVNSLIKENQRLKRQLARLEAKSVANAGSSATKGLSTIARRVQRALSATATGVRSARRRSAAATRGSRGSAIRVRRPASPETQAKRLAALAKAREVRAAKKAAAS